MSQLIGNTIAFPIQISASGSPVVVTGEELINQSIYLILLESEGTPFFLGEYGSRVATLRYAPNDLVFESLMRTFVFEALSTWEKRITVSSITIELSGEQAQVEIRYLINGASEESSYVFPFYREILA